VSGLATAGTFALGFTILRQDRRKANHAEATEVVAWFVNKPDGFVELNVVNGANRPIMHLMFILACRNEDGTPARGVRMIDVAPVLQPQNQTSLNVPFSEFHANTFHPSYIQFRDSSGNNWQRDVRSGKLKKTKVGPRRLRHLKRRLHLRRSGP
jgi:hypothetical protein